MRDRNQSFSAFWGKARPSASDVVRSHPLWAHGLDVAAVGLALAELRPPALVHAAQRLGWPVDIFVTIWAHLLALHDIGKFAPQFQMKVPDLYPKEILGEPIALQSLDPGHPTAGFALLATCFNQPPLERQRPAFQRWERYEAAMLLAPILGHHGQPADEGSTPWRHLFSPPAASAALDYWDLIARLLPAPEDVPVPVDEALLSASWSIAGLTALADWIGSNKTWFPYVEAEMEIEAYWLSSRERARAAVRYTGLHRARSAAVSSFSALTGLAHTPTDAQSWAEKIAVPDGPVLAIIEDVTGGGKTEAALMLAHRLIAEGRAHGLFLALPTMATANAMFDRVKEIAPRFFDREQGFTLSLAHGAAHLHPEYGARETLPTADTDPRAATDDSARIASEWLMSENRKALLADVGIGTIDQALLAVLPTRFQCVRLAGLAGKVLIVDEAHAFDAYVARELDTLIAFHTAQGGSTIVLSATLPGGVKERLLKTWRSAVQAPWQIPGFTSYPAVTFASRTSASVTSLAARADLVRNLRLTRVADVSTAIDRIVSASRRGAAVVWVRNTVDDAIAAVRKLREAGVETELFHARFAMGDRLRIEEAARSRFGKGSTPEQREGRVLVATQVIEQSLDVDFDLVVSDLAPFDLLLQRAGRLWRHTHRHRPIDGPELIVISPDPDGVVASDWISAVLPGTAVVYGDHAILWRSARVIAMQPAFRVPDDVRAAIEAVYSEDEEDIPAALTRSHDKARGEDSAARAFADYNLLDCEAGYRAGTQGWGNESIVSTRLGEETRSMRLALFTGASLVPFADDPDETRAWALSEVRVAERRMKGAFRVFPGFEAAAQTAKATWSRFDRDRLVLLPLIPEADGIWSGTLATDDGRELALRYSQAEGLLFS